MFTYFLTDQRPCYLRVLISFLCPQKSIGHPYLKKTSPFQLHRIKVSMLQSWKDSLCPHSPSFTGLRSDVSLGSLMQPFLAATMMVYLTGVTFFFFSCWMVSDSLWPHGLQPTRLLCPWDSPGKNTGVGCHAFLQGILSTQGLNPRLLHCRQILYCLRHKAVTFNATKQTSRQRYFRWWKNLSVLPFLVSPKLVFLSSELCIMAGHWGQPWPASPPDMGDTKLPGVMDRTMFIFLSCLCTQGCPYAA